VDLYWATFAAMLRPLPDALCPMPDMIRSAYGGTTPEIVLIYPQLLDPVALAVYPEGGRLFWAQTSGPYAYNDKILMYSDGLTEARNASDREFGSQRLLESITQAPANQIFDQIFEDLDSFCGNITTQADDVTLVEITCVHEVLPEIEMHDYIRPTAHLLGDRGEWKLSLRFNGTRLRESNPVPILVSYLLEMEELEAERQALFTVMTELYVNALDHGVLGLDSRLKSDPAGFEAYFQTRESRLASLDSGYVIFNLSVEQQSTRRSILLRIEDSGKGFDYQNHDPPTTRETALSGRGILLIQDLCESLEYHGKGNIAIARFSWSTT